VGVLGALCNRSDVSKIFHRGIGARAMNGQKSIKYDSIIVKKSYNQIASNGTLRQ
jgi:hypothetical protein